MKNLNIILLEDSPDDADLIQRVLDRAGIQFTAMVVEKRTEYEDALNGFQPDVILCDHSLPQFNSIEAFQLFKEYQNKRNVLIPFILVTGEVSEEFAVQCLKAGVDDYVIKDRLKRLPLAIESALEKCRMETERLQYLREVIVKQAMMAEVEQLAHLGSWQADLLTGTHTWADEIYSMFGYKKGEVEPCLETFFDLVHPDDVSFLRNCHEEVIKHLNKGETEFRLINKQGQLRYISARLQVHRDTNGNPVRLVGFNLDITDRKKAEMRLQKSEQEYKSLFDQNPDAVFSMDLTGTFTKVNRAVMDLTGMTAEVLCGMNFSALLHPDDHPRINSYFLSALERTARRFEARFKNTSGKTLLFDVTYMPIVVNDDIIGVHGVAKDITRKRALEDMLDQAYRFARIGGWDLDMPAQKLIWTDITREIHEVESDFEPDVEKGIGFYKEGKSSETIRRAVEQCMRDGTAYDVEVQIITAKGNERWVRATGEADIKNGKCERLFGTFQDIHERKTAEETLKEAYREKINILESIGDGFFAVDKQSKVTYWNSVAEKMLCMPREKILGKSLWDVYADAVPLAFYREYHRAMEGNIPVHFEEYYPALNIWVEADVYPTENGLSIYFKDITDQKKHVREIQHQNAQLKEIARIQSHEVRAPLARIIGLASLLQDGLQQQGELPRLLSDIQTSAHELDGLIRKIVRKTEEMGYNKDK